MRISISFDTEDYISPESVGNDDLLKMLAEIMADEGIVGSFFLIGEKLRCMRDRGRDDVLAQLRRHHVGSHVNLGSIHPTLAERASEADWADGMARMAADEVAAIEEMGEVLGAEAFGYRQHGGSYAPQFVAALGRAGQTCGNSPAELPKHNITWYCNALNFRPAYVGFQQYYFDRDKLLEREKEFYTFVEQLKDYDWFEVFHSHPYMIKMDGSLCKNYYRGIYTPPEQWQQLGVRPEYDEAALRENWAWHCQRLREDPNIEVKSIKELAQEFAKQAESADAREIAALAQMAADISEPFWTDRFSGAEIIDLLARAYLHLRKTGELPAKLERRDVLGPSQMPLATPTARVLKSQAIARIARGVEHAVRLTGAVPSRIFCAEGTLGSMGEVGLGTALRVLGEAVASKDASRDVTPLPVDPYPSEGDAMVGRIQRNRHWNPHRRDLDLTNISRHTALQSWTLKPAWPGEPPAFA